MKSVWVWYKHDRVTFLFSELLVMLLLLFIWKTYMAISACYSNTNAVLWGNRVETRQNTKRSLVGLISGHERTLSSVSTRTHSFSLPVYWWESHRKHKVSTQPQFFPWTAALCRVSKAIQMWKKKITQDWIALQTLLLRTSTLTRLTFKMTCITRWIKEPNWLETRLSCLCGFVPKILL